MLIHSALFWLRKDLSASEPRKVRFRLPVALGTRRCLRHRGVESRRSPKAFCRNGWFL